MAITLSSLKRGREIKPPLIVFYGVHGIGKSTWGSEAVEPVFIQTEEGLNTLDVTKFPKATSVHDVYLAIAALAKEEHTFKTVVLDTIDWFEKLVHFEVRKVHGEAIFTDYGKGYKFAIPYFEKLLEGLTYLRDNRGMSVIVLGHSKITQFSSPDQPAYDRYSLDLHDGVATTVEEWADAVLFANYQVFVTKEDVGFGKKEGKASGKGDRVVFSQERPPYRAKNRYNLPLELPMSYGAFVRAMGEGLKSMQASKIPAPQPSPVHHEESKDEPKAKEETKEAAAA